MPISTTVFKSNTEGTNAIRTVRHSEAPQRRKFYMAGGGFRTLAGQGSSPATQRRQTWRVFRFRSEDTADCGEHFVRPTARGLSRACGRRTSARNDYTNTQFGLRALPDGDVRQRGLSSPD